MGPVEHNHADLINPFLRPAMWASEKGASVDLYGVSARPSFFGKEIRDESISVGMSTRMALCRKPLVTEK